MKKALFLILFSSVCSSQIHLQDEDRYSIHILTDYAIFSDGIFYGGVEFQAEFSNGVYIRPQIHYASLKDGYLETSSGIGFNFSKNKWNNVNAYTGIKLGVISRASIYPIFGFEGGVEVNVFKNLALGLRCSYDKRGDSDFYEGKQWQYNSQGYIKLIL